MARHPSVLGIVGLSVTILVAVLYMKQSHILERYADAPAPPKDGISTGTIVPVPAVTNPPGVVPQLMFVALLCGLIAAGYAIYSRR